MAILLAVCTLCSGCFISVRAGPAMMLSGPDALDAGWYVTAVSGVQMEFAGTLRLAAAGSSNGIGHDAGGEEVSVTSPTAGAEVSVTWKDRYGAPNAKEQCDYNKGMRTRISVFAATTGEGDAGVKYGGADPDPKAKRSTQVTGGSLMGAMIEGGVFNITPCANMDDVMAGGKCMPRWLAGGLYLGIGLAHVNQQSAQFGSANYLVPMGSITYEWMPMGWGAMFDPDRPLRGVQRVHVLKFYKCSDYHAPDTEAFRICEANRARAASKAAQQRSRELQEKKCY